MASSQLFENIYEDYLKILEGRPLTEPEIRAKRCTENLQVPDWYQKYLKPPPKIISNKIPFECRPPSWKIQRGKCGGSPRKLKKQSPRNSPKKSLPSKSPILIDDGNSNKKISVRKHLFEKNKNSTTTINPSSLTAETHFPTSNTEIPANLSKAIRSSYQGSNTFPRVSPSRKVNNINIVFPKPLPSQEAITSPTHLTTKTFKKPIKSTPKTTYTMTKRIEMHEVNSNVNTLNNGKNHVSFLIAEVQPNGVTTHVRVLAGVDDTDEELDEEVTDDEISPSFSSDMFDPILTDVDDSDLEISDHETNLLALPDTCISGFIDNDKKSSFDYKRTPMSPSTRFLKSNKKSTELQKIVKSSLSESGNGRMIQGIIDELDRSIADARSYINGPSNFFRNLLNSKESNYDRLEEENEEDRCSSQSSYDSELNKSTSISLNSDDISEKPFSPAAELSETEEDAEVYWIPCKNRNLLQSSKLSSIFSINDGFRCSSSNEYNNSDRDFSPDLSPIKKEGPEDWDLNFTNKMCKVSRQLFSINESEAGDSGYSDSATGSRTGTLNSNKQSNSILEYPESEASSRTAMLSSNRESPDTSISSSPSSTHSFSQTKFETKSMSARTEFPIPVGGFVTLKSILV